MARSHLFWSGQDSTFWPFGSKRSHFGTKSYRTWPNWACLSTFRRRRLRLGRARTSQIWPAWARISPNLAIFAPRKIFFVRKIGGFWATSHARACILCVYTLGQIWPFDWSFWSKMVKNDLIFEAIFGHFLMTASGEHVFNFFKFIFI